MKKIVLAAGSFLFCLQSWSQESLSTRIHNNYQSPRAMGMGNAFSAVADDYAALFYNPSMLVYRKNSEFQINIISAAVANQTPSLSNDFKEVSNRGGTDSEKAVALSNVLEKYYGKPLGARISPLEFIWVSPTWGVSLILADTTVDIMVQRQVGPALDVHLIKDTSINYAYAWFLGKESSMGVLGKFTHRNEMATQYSALDLAIDSKIVDFKKTREGMNFDVDISYTWKPVFNSGDRKAVGWTTPKQEKFEARKIAQIEIPKKDVKTLETEPKKTENESKKTESKTAGAITAEAGEAEDVVDVSKEPKAPKTPEELAEEAAIVTETDGIQINTKRIVEQEILEEEQPLAVTAVLRNVISMAFTKSAMVNKDATQPPPKNFRVLDIGASYGIHKGLFSDLKFVIEAKNLLHPEASMYKSSHLGIEYSLLNTDWFKTQIRAGMNQLYFTAGLSLILGPLDLEFATYGEEYGTNKARTQNRVSVVTVGLKF